MNRKNVIQLAVAFAAVCTTGATWAANADVWAVLATGICTTLLLFIPFIPGLRDIPHLIPIHRLIWRTWNSSPTPATAGEGDTIGL